MTHIQGVQKVSVMFLRADGISKNSENLWYKFTIENLTFSKVQTVKVKFESIILSRKLRLFFIKIKIENIIYMVNTLLRQ